MFLNYLGFSSKVPIKPHKNNGSRSIILTWQVVYLQFWKFQRLFFFLKAVEPAFCIVLLSTIECSWNSELCDSWVGLGLGKDGMPLRCHFGWSDNLRRGWQGIHWKKARNCSFWKKEQACGDELRWSRLKLAFSSSRSVVGISEYQSFYLYRRISDWNLGQRPQWRSIKKSKSKDICKGKKKSVKLLNLLFLQCTHVSKHPTGYAIQFNVNLRTLQTKIMIFTHRTIVKIEGNCERVLSNLFIILWRLNKRRGKLHFSTYKEWVNFRGGEMAQWVSSCYTSVRAGIWILSTHVHAKWT